MKKIFALIACAMLSVNVANAQLSNILNKAASAVQSAAGKSGNSTLSSITNVITSKLVPTSSQIVGTWKYQKPAVMFTSESAVKNATGALASSAIEDKLQNNYLSKIGFVKNNMSITFKQDKTFSISRSNKVVASGTYAISGNEVSLTFKNKKQPCKLTPQLDNGTLVLVTDATKLKTFLESMGSKIQSLSAITSLTKNMTGMKLGIRMAKQ